MIQIIDKHACVGCRACQWICPKRCIDMQVDNEGFLYPAVDAGRCVDCSLCEKVCPVAYSSESSVPLRTIGCKAIDCDEQQAGSSGGLFGVLAKAVIAAGGVVCAARFDEDWNVVHDFAATTADLAPFRRSKYVQSDTRDSFPRIKAYLDAGRNVLFCGTPCQVKGLLGFLRKPYENLLTVDFVCHGVPSPLVWQTYLEALRAEVGDEWRIAHIDFRSKAHGGWHKYGLAFRFRSTADGAASKEIFNYPGKNPFYQLFIQNISLRPSCYCCPAKGLASGSDITIGDFWGIERVAPEHDDVGGVSLCLCHTERAVRLLPTLPVRLFDIDYSLAVKSNPSVGQSVREPAKRKAFFAVAPTFTMKHLKRASGLDLYGRSRRKLIESALKLLKR